MLRRKQRMLIVLSQFGKPALLVILVRLLSSNCPIQLG
jgi:hypothetical protein